VNGGRALSVADVIGLLVGGRFERLAGAETREATPALAQQPQTTGTREVHRRLGLAVRTSHMCDLQPGECQAIVRLPSLEVTRISSRSRVNGTTVDLDRRARDARATRDAHRAADLDPTDGHDRNDPAVWPNNPQNSARLPNTVQPNTTPASAVASSTRRATTSGR